MSKPGAQLSLLVGNFVVGSAVVLPTGMLKPLSASLGVTIAQVGLMVTYGAVVLCFGSPLMAWWTSRIDRRVLLASTLGLLALGHAASALVSSYGALLVLRLAMLSIGAIFTPQAAGTVALIVPEKERASAIAFVFLGWSLAIAAGLPLVAAGAEHLGWRAVFGALGAAAAVGGAFLYLAVPAGLRPAPLSGSSWRRIAHERALLLLLALTAVQVAGQFAVFTFLAPLLVRTAQASTAAIGIFFATFGVAGFAGNMIASRIVKLIDAYRVTWLFMASVFAGLLLWTFGRGSLPVMGVGMGLWGLGFAAINSMQQARLVQTAPSLAGASVALNTSCIYVGQAIGSAVGGALFARGRLAMLNYAALAFLVAGFSVLYTTRPTKLRNATSAGTG